jgi:hypothetical protein
MPDFIIETVTTGREVYVITAENKEKAEHILYTNAPQPQVSEATTFEIESIKEL